MPDLLTHTGIGALLRVRRPRTALVWFVIGSALPDLASRLPGLGLALVSWITGIQMSLSVLEATGLCHTPLPYAVLCWLVALLLPRPIRATAAVNLLAGGWLHLALDATQTHLNGGYTLLFPFTLRRFELGWVEADDSLMLAPLFAAALATVVGWRWWRDRRAASD